LDFTRNFVGEIVGRTSMPETTLTAEENAVRLVEAHGLDDGANIIIDASGAESSIQTSIHTLRSGGTFVQAGMGKRRIEFPISELCEKELVIK
jgi:D-xylulose reductase